MHWKNCLAAFTIALSPALASAANLVTLTFDSLSPGSSYFENLVENGFRISPSCHVDGVFGAISFDSSGCWNDETRNLEYLGPDIAGGPWGGGRAYLYIDHFGKPFSFVSFEQSPSFGWYDTSTISSSKGGFFSGPFSCTYEASESGECSEFRKYTLGGPDWNGVKWILFSYEDPGEPAWQLDNLVFRVPTPASVALLLAGAAALGLRRRLR